MQTGVPVISGSLGNDARRPRFVPRAAGLRVQSALSLPMLITITGQVIGAINAFAYAPDAFGEARLSGWANSSPRPLRWRCTTRSCWQVLGTRLSSCNGRW